MYKHYYLVFFLIINTCFSQNTFTPTKYQLESGFYLSTSGQMPFWLRSNQYGIVPLESQIATIRGAAYKEYDSTRIYSFINLLSLWFVNTYQISFINNDLIIILGLGLLVFNFFNFRAKAKCFAGDVGSISIAFAILFLIVNLIIKTENFTYILFLVVYGIDTTLTIILRVWLRENIFQAHNKHLFQLLVRERKLSHLQVTISYILLQAFINVILINIAPKQTNNITLSLSIIVALVSIYIYLRQSIYKQHYNH